MTDLDRLPAGLFDRRLLIVSGKGGVGKTIVSAALASLAARRRRSVLLVSEGGRGDAPSLFGKSDRGYVEAELSSSLRGLSAGFDGLLADFVHTVAPLPFVADRILASSTFRYFTRATPGLPDLLLFGKIREVLKRTRSTRKAPAYDLVVLDAPATGHALSLFRMPRALLGATPAGPLRHVAEDLDRLLSDPGSAALVVVAEPAEFAAREAEELSAVARKDAGLATALVVVNRIGRSGRPETLPEIDLPVLRIPEIEPPEEISDAGISRPDPSEETNSSKGGERSRHGAAAAFFDHFLFTFKESAAAPERAVGPTAPASRRAREAKASSLRYLPATSLLLSHRLDLAPWLDEAPLIVLTGPGGVGKTTLAAALGIAAARRGRRVLVLTVDPARRLAQALGLAAAEERSAEPVPVPLRGTPKGSLHALQIDPKATFERLLSRVASPAALERIQRNRLYAGLVDSLPGVLEYMGVEALHEHAHDAGIDLLLLDTPPAGRGLDFLAAPDRMVELLENDALRWFLRGDSLLSRALSGASRGAAAVLRLADNVLGFGFLSDLADFFRAFDGLYDGFAERSREISALLETARHLVVSSLDETALLTAAGTASALVGRGASPGLLLNRVPAGTRPPALPPPLASLPAVALRESAAPAPELPEILAAAFV
ncbi:MAG: ArsA-related P-loop ATPase [Acidithiobacillales bacterium]